MPAERLGDSNVTYLSIVGGKLVQKVNEGTEGAVKREYDVDGNKGVKWELQYKNLSGFITEMVFKQSDYGEMFSVKIEKNGETDLLTMNTSSRYFSDFGRKLKNVDLTKEVTMNPYDFENNGKQIRGLSITQEGEKIEDAYYDWDKKKALNGMPDVSEKERKEFDKDDWKIFFVKIKKFLKEEIQKVELPSVTTDTRKGDEISVEDLPF